MDGLSLAFWWPADALEPGHGPMLATIGRPGAAPQGPPADAPGTTSDRPQPSGTPLYNFLADSYSSILIVTGAIVVLAVVYGRLKAVKVPKPPTLEERLARLTPTGPRGAALPASEYEPRGMPASAPARPRSPQPAAPAREDTASADALDAVVRDTEELAQHLARAMDTRAARLETLIREADDRLRRLEQARTWSTPALPDGRGGESMGPGRSPSGSHLAVRPTAGEPRDRVGSIENDPADAVQRQIFALADEGLGPVEIARRVNQPTGQIELMLALRGR